MDEKLINLEQLNSQIVKLKNKIQVLEDEKINLTVQIEELKSNHEKDKSETKTAHLNQTKQFKIDIKNLKKENETFKNENQTLKGKTIKNKRK